MSASAPASDFGGKLKQAREQRGVSLREIATSTKISVVALEALERNDISKLPGGIFSRAFVRSYAGEIGLDPEETVREFLAAFPDETVRIGSPQAVQQRKDLEQREFESRRHVVRTLFKLLVVSLPLGLLLLYFSTRGGSPPAPAGGQPLPSRAARPAVVPDEAAASGGAAAPPPAEIAPPAGTTPPMPAPAAAGEGGAVTPSPPAARPAGPDAASAESVLRLEIAPTAACWVSLTVDGTVVLERVMQPGERIARRIRSEAVVQVGDAGAFAYTINGRPGRALGTAGQVRTLRITPDDYETLLR